MNLLLPLFASFLQHGAVATQPASPPAIVPVRLERIVAATSSRHLTEQGIRQHIEHLASDGMAGREAGSPEGDLAAQYVAERFREAALTPMGEGQSPAGERLPFQSFDVSLGRRLKGDNRVNLRGKDHSASFAHDRKEMVPLPYTATGDVYGTLAFVGYGIVDTDASHDDYAGIDVKGKVVLALRGAPAGSKLDGEIRKKIYNARNQGAVGFLLVELPAEDRLVPDNLPPFRSTRFDAGIPAAAVRYWLLRSAIPGLFALADPVRREGKSAPRVLEDVTARVHIEAEELRGVAKNVLGLLRGEDPALRDEIVAIGAHYDHLGRGIEGAVNPDDAGQIHNGADDNASGTAVMLALASALSAERLKLRRSILFLAFSGEEKGLLGSRWFLEHPTVAKERIVAMLNLDMVGRSKDGSVAAIGSGTSPLWPGLLQAISPEGRIRLNEVSIGGSDHQPFIAAGIPALHFFTGVHADYHRPGDDVDKIQGEHALGIARMVFDVAAHLSITAERPGFVAPPPPRAQSPGAGSGRPYLGTIPDYAGGKDGVLLDGVTKGSPADKAGVQKGDVLVQLGVTKIGNIEDFQFALGKHRPGDEVVVVVKRGGAEVELKVMLGARGE